MRPANGKPSHRCQAARRRSAPCPMLRLPKALASTDGCSPGRIARRNGKPCRSRRSRRAAPTAISPASLLWPLWRRQAPILTSPASRPWSRPSRAVRRAFRLYSSGGFAVKVNSGATALEFNYSPAPTVQIAAYQAAVPTTSQLLMRYVAAEKFVFPANFARRPRKLVLARRRPGRLYSWSITAPDRHHLGHQHDGDLRHVRHVEDGLWPATSGFHRGAGFGGCVDRRHCLQSHWHEERMSHGQSGKSKTSPFNMMGITLISPTTAIIIAVVLTWGRSSFDIPSEQADQDEGGWNLHQLFVHEISYHYARSGSDTQIVLRVNGSIYRSLVQ